MIRARDDLGSRGNGIARPGARFRRRDRGAALIEFAIVVPVLFLLLFGIIEFGWGFMQQLDVRHGAREGIRLAAVNAAPSNGEAGQAENIAREVCLRMDDSGPTPTVSISLVRDQAGAADTADIGDSVSVTVERELNQLTGFLGFALNDITLRSTVETRLEQAATYSDLENFKC